jgi:hypothetical protein
MFRPGIMTPTKGLKNTLKLYTWLGWIIPILRVVAPNSLCSLKEVGLAMIHAVQSGYPKSVLEIKDIVSLAKNSR